MVGTDRFCTVETLDPLTNQKKTLACTPIDVSKAGLVVEGEKYLQINWICILLCFASELSCIIVIVIKS